MDLQVLSQCGSTSNCLSRSVPEIHWHVAGSLSNQPTNKQTVPEKRLACSWDCKQPVNTVGTNEYLRAADPLVKRHLDVQPAVVVSVSPDCHSCSIVLTVIMQIYSYVSSSPSEGLLRMLMNTGEIGTSTRLTYLPTKLPANVQSVAICVTISRPM